MLRWAASRGARCTAAVATSVRGAKTRGFEGLSEKDPFGKKIAWDKEPAFAKWSNVDVDHLKESVQDDQVQATHFGPDWARLNTVMRSAGKRMREKPKAQHDANSDQAVQHSTAQDGSEVTAMNASARWDERTLGRLPQTYEELAEAEDGEAEEAETAVPFSLQKDGPDRRAVAAELRAQTHVEEATLAGGKTPAESPPPAEDEGSADAKASPSSVTDGISPKEPLEWETRDVVEWLRRYGNIDDDMASAFEMIGVNGRLLLDLQPPSLFRVMRKWHNRGRTVNPEVTEILVQETVYNCYPYGK
jgi:hypothetical protein